MTMVSTTTMTASSRTETGMPRTLPPPRISKKGSDSGRPVTCVPLESARARPRSIQPMASVPMSDGMPMTWLVKALAAPTAVATTSVMATAIQGLKPSRMSTATTMPVRMKLPPTERSISFWGMRKTMPAAMMAA